MTLKKGAIGALVAELQQLLTRAGYKVAADGWFGDATEQAVLAFQRDHLIVAIGQAGPRTMAALRGAAIGNQLTITDLQQAADRLCVELAKLAAFAQVEAAGEGFDECQRPRLLFERHVFFKQIAKQQGEADANRLAGLYPALCNPKRGGYQGGPAEWARLQTAMTLHRAAAIESASWGMFQVMGYHWQELGYASADDWLAAMQQSEREHLRAVVGFIELDPLLHKALKAGKWSEVARRYNGPAYKENRYDTKLAEAYDHFAKVYPVQEVADATA
ncbi:N-acetylmuramidase domain-containing protein [Aeromonas veronii]|uniref:N-acetylmuramidase domain-containing protein n=1 Tax=Aeromonas veronii TaxID=654 RepID=UPI003D1BD2F7